MSSKQPLKDFSIHDYNNLLTFNGLKNSGCYDSAKGVVMIENRNIISPLGFMNNPPPNPNILFKDCTFREDIIFKNSTFERSYSFIDCTFEKVIVFNGGKYEKNIRFFGGNINGNLIINDGKFSNLYIGANCNSIEVHKGKFQEFNILGASPYVKNWFAIEKLVFNFKYIEGIINIREVHLEKLKLAGTFHKDAELLIKDINFSEIVIEDLYNNGKIRFFDLITVPKPDETTWFWILRSNLGKAEFFNVNLSRVKNIIINSTIFLDCTFINVVWPDNLNISDQVSGELNLLDKKEMYRQLKYSYWKQGDAVLENKFHGLEMDAYLDYLNVSEQIFTWKHFEVKIVLWLSKLTSDFGQSFIRPLLTVLILGTVSLAILVKMGKVPGLYWSCNSNISDILGTFPDVIKLINPLHKNEPELTGCAYVIDVIMRVISSYCLYNIIRATRRFVR